MCVIYEYLSVCCVQKRLEEDLCWIVDRVPSKTQAAKELNWTDCTVKLTKPWVFYEYWSLSCKTHQTLGILWILITELQDSPNPALSASFCRVLNLNAARGVIMRVLHQSQGSKLAEEVTQSEHFLVCAPHHLFGDPSGSKVMELSSRLNWTRLERNTALLSLLKTSIVFCSWWFLTHKNIKV